MTKLDLTLTCITRTQNGGLYSEDFEILKVNFQSSTNAIYDKSYEIWHKYTCDFLLIQNEMIIF